MSKGSKRQRTEENEEEETQHVALPDGLRALMGGRKFCPQEELTREVLLQYLKAQGDIREVNLVEVTVQTMSGRSFGVVLEVDTEVKLLKSGIEEAEGTAARRQDLLMLREGGGREGDEVPLADDFEISEPCSVALCVSVAEGNLRSCWFMFSSSEIALL